MKIKERDIVSLNDGREGTILGFYGDGDMAMLEMTDGSGNVVATPLVRLQDIAEVTDYAD